MTADVVVVMVGLELKAGSSSRVEELTREAGHIFQPHPGPSLLSTSKATQFQQHHQQSNSQRGKFAQDHRRLTHHLIQFDGNQVKSGHIALHHTTLIM